MSDEFKGNGANVFTENYWPTETDAVQKKVNQVKKTFSDRFLLRLNLLLRIIAFDPFPTPTVEIARFNVRPGLCHEVEEKVNVMN